MTPIPRRMALLAAASLLGAAAASPEAIGLNERALRRGRFFGAAIDSGLLAHDAAYMDCVAVECGVLTGEASFKWGALRPGPDTYNYDQADRLLAYAQRHSMAVRGHALLWHEDNPTWLIDMLTPANAGQLLTRHIAAVAGHCRGRVIHWDVVNEVLWPQDGKPLGLRDTLWYRAMGPDFLDLAFHRCAEADPGSLRFINDYGLDYAWDEDERKRQAMLELLSRMKDRGVPVQGLGIQAHLDAAVKELDQAKLAQFCSDVAALGMKIVITELDVRDNRLPADPAIRDEAVAAHARLYLEAVLSCPAVLGVITWGLSDRRSWLDDKLPRPDKLPQRPLPLDAELRRKKMWHAIADAFATAPARS